jgi:ACS family hexuronate transporter-like MFS transporter
MLQPTRVSSRGHVRWYICGLLFFATTVNYVDRQVIGILKPTLERELHWNEASYGWVVFAFQCAYALMMPFVGRLIDRIGTRLGYALAVVVWSAASMFHSVARTTWQFAIARFALGLGESANFPAAIRTVADWFPRRERALATGIFNSGSNVGAIIAPLLVPVVALHLGWRASFLVTGGLDLVWLAAWLTWFRLPTKHRGLSAAELEWIQSDSADEPSRRIPWPRLIRKRAAWAFLLGKLMTDPVWWFYLFWIPGFLHRAWGLELTALGPPLVAIYVAADVGSIGGGSLAALFAFRGWSPNAARKTAMLICACGPVPVVALLFVKTLWPAVLLIGLAAAAHQGWSANLYTLVSDTFPRSAVASVVGLGGFAGALGGMLTAPMVGYWLDFSHDSYRPLFVVAGVAYLAALGVIQLLLPKLERSYM